MEELFLQKKGLLQINITEELTLHTYNKIQIVIKTDKASHNFIIVEKDFDLNFE
jgi:hypothetical protein